MSGYPGAGEARGPNACFSPLGCQPGQSGGTCRSMESETFSQSAEILEIRSKGVYIRSRLLAERERERESSIRNCAASRKES